MAKICLDAGHGGKDPGACGCGRAEKDDVLRVCARVGQILVGKGHDIYYTRTTDVYESPYQKATEANNAGADFFASFHRNSAGSSASGYETWVYENVGKAKACADVANKNMSDLGFKNRGTKVSKVLTVLNSTKMEAVLFEIGFISNSGDNSIFVSKFEDICQGLASAILAAVGASSSNTGGTTNVKPTPTPAPGKKELGHVDCCYRCYTDRWWPEVKNQEDWGGKGDNVAIRYLGICVSKGKIKGRVYTAKNGWLPWLTFTNSYNINDLENGVLGDGSDILAIELYYYTPDGYVYKEVHYRVSVKGNSSFYAKQIDNKKEPGMDGFAGDKKNFIDKFQAWIE